VLRDVMFVDERSLNPLWEDPVTTAVNAAQPMLSEDDRRRIELLVVASESGVDYEKPMSTWVQRYLGLTANCRNFEVKHACYGGTSGLQMAAHWIATGLNRGAKALVICTDQSRTHLNQPWEYVLGAGAVAVLVSERPAIAELEVGKSGYWTHEVSDLIRPTGSVEMGNSETSLVSYLDALENAFDHFVERNPEFADYEGVFRKHIYHAPFGGMTYRAHKTLMRRFRRMSKDEIQAHYAGRTGASLVHLRRFGGSYSGSTFVGLLGLIEGSDDLAPGDRISMFSYGSGSCAEFYSVKYVDGARGVARAAGASGLLDARRDVSVQEYERIETRRTELVEQRDYAVPTSDAWFDEYYRDKGRLVFLGVRDYYRQYAWS
jgi:3-hydroxy-3-methylglutaryl CoA synthase